MIKNSIVTICLAYRHSNQMWERVRRSHKRSIIVRPVSHYCNLLNKEKEMPWDFACERARTIYLLYAWYLSVILCLGSGISVCSLWHDAFIIYQFFGILKIEWKLIKCQFYLLTTPNIKINNEFSGKTCNAGAWVNHNMSRKGCIMFWRILNYYFKSDWIFASGS